MASTEPNVYLFVPNLIGYARVALMFVAFYFMTNAEMYHVTVTCYLLSQLLDAVDGHAARLLGQTSKLGAMLDMLTDRFVRYFPHQDRRELLNSRLFFWKRNL